MPYRCVHCEKLYDDGASELLSGCSNCGRKFFFYIKKDKMKTILAKEESEVSLTSKEKENMELDIRDITGIQEEEIPVFLDFESVKILKPGKYLLDVSKLFETRQPKVYQLEDGKYIIDLAM